MAKEYTPADHLNEATGLLEHVATQGRAGHPPGAPSISLEQSIALSLAALAHATSGLLRWLVEN